MTKAVETLDNIRKGYLRVGKIIQASVITEAIKAIKYHEKKEQVPTQASDTGCDDLCEQWVQTNTTRQGDERQTHQPRQLVSTDTRARDTY